MKKNELTYGSPVHILPLAVIFGVFCLTAVSSYAAVQLFTVPFTKMPPFLLFTVLLVLSLHYVLLASFFRFLRFSPVRIDLFSPAVYFPAVFSLYFGIGSLKLTAREQAVTPETYYYYLIAILAYFAGLYLAGSMVAGLRSFARLFARRLTGRAASARTFAASRLRSKIAVVALCLIAVPMVALISLKSGLPIFDSDFQNARVDVIRIVGAKVYYLALLTSDILVILFVNRIVSGSFPFRTKLLSVAIIAFSFFVLFSLGSRTRVIYPVLVSAIFFYNYSQYRIRYTRIMGYGAVLFFFLVLYGSLRYQTADGGTFYEAFIRLFFGEINLAANTFSRVLAWFPYKMDFMGVKVFFLAFLTLLPGVQEDFGTILKEAMGLEYSGGAFTPSLVGSFYVANGATAIVIGMFCIGFFMSWYYNRHIKYRPDKQVWPFLLYSYLVIYSLNILKGGLLKDVEIFFHIGVLWLSFKFIMVKKRRGAAEPETRRPSL